MIQDAQGLVDALITELEIGGAALPGVYGMWGDGKPKADPRTVTLLLRGGSRLVLTIKHEPHDPADEDEPGPAVTCGIVVNGEARSLYDCGEVKDGDVVERVYTDQIRTVCGHVPCPFFREDGSVWE